MSKFIDSLDKISDLLGGKRTPDQILEENAKLSGVSIIEPNWYRFILKKLTIIITILAFIIVGTIYLLSNSKEYLSIKGVKAVMYLLVPAIGLVLLPLMAIANIQKKKKFRTTLTSQQQILYDSAIKKRINNFITLFIVTLIVSVMFGFVIYYYITNN